MPTHQQLILRPQHFAIGQLPPDAPVPDWCPETGFSSITRTTDELSIVCEQQHIPHNIKASRNWRLLQIAAQLDFSLVGILAGIATPLAEAGISIFSLSTYDTDYLLIQSDQIEQALEVLTSKGYMIEATSI